MKLFKKDSEVFFIQNEKIIEGTIDRNNGVNTGTYNVTYLKDGDAYKDLMVDTLLFKDKESLEVELEKQIKVKEEQNRSNTQYNKDKALRTITRNKERIINNIKTNKEYEAIIKDEEEKVKEYDKLLTLRLEN